MPGFLDALMSLAVTTVVGLTAAAQLYQAWRAIEETLNNDAAAATARRRRRGHGDLAALERVLGRGGLRAVQDGGRGAVRVVTPDGETVLVFTGTTAALEALGVLAGGGGGGGGSDDDDDLLDPAAARVAAIAGTGRDFGPDDYDALSALDAGVRRRRGGGGRGRRVREEDVDRLPTHAHRGVSGGGGGGGGGGGEAPPAAAAAADTDGPSTSCPVCLTAYTAGDCLRTLPCVHSFHSECVDPWLLSHGVGDAACPVCKTLVFEDAG